MVSHVVKVLDFPVGISDGLAEQHRQSKHLVFTVDRLFFNQTIPNCTHQKTMTILTDT